MSAKSLNPAHCKHSLNISVQTVPSTLSDFRGDEHSRTTEYARRNLRYDHTIIFRKCSRHAHSRHHRRDIIPPSFGRRHSPSPFPPALFLADDPECSQATPAESVGLFAAPDLTTITLVMIYFILHSKIGEKGNVV
jgi:hypothetical protein